MACEICGRNSCTRSFHSLEEQEAFDNIADAVKERCRRIIHAEVRLIDGEHGKDDAYMVDLNKVLEVISNADL